MPFCRVCKKKIGAQRRKNICDWCCWEIEKNKSVALAQAGHTCQRRLDFQKYPYVQWCGSTSCRNLPLFPSFSSASESILILHDVRSGFSGLKAEQHYYLLFLKKMTFENWLLIDTWQNFTTFTEAIKGYVCCICQQCSNEETPIFANPDNTFVLCTDCVRRAKRNLKCDKRDAFSVSLMVEAFPLFFLQEFLVVINFPLVLTKLCLDYVLLSKLSLRY